MLQLVLSPLWVASQRWPWLKNIFDFKIDQWHVAFEFATFRVCFDSMGSTYSS